MRIFIGIIFWVLVLPLKLCLLLAQLLLLCSGIFIDLLFILPQYVNNNPQYTIYQSPIYWEAFLSVLWWPFRRKE